ncbi:MAG TPA: 3'-5' exonuclease [Pseudonocardiaceae bacterium]|nr:3'-5' exonuclease [Pseudonocardiaceae bacterium]
MTAPAWANGTLVSFDTETTGIDPETARIVTASVIVIRPGEKPHIGSWLIDPGVEIPAAATEVHGVTTEHAQAEGQRPDTALVDICTTLAMHVEQGAPLIVYNAPYDLTLLDRECRRYGLATLTDPSMTTGPLRVVDPLVIDRALDRYRRGKRTLTATSSHYGVPISDADAHGSTADALCAARVAWKIAHRYPVACDDLDTLQIRQAAWHREWATHFVEYLRGQGKPADDVTMDWPMRAVLTSTL